MASRFDPAEWAAIYESPRPRGHQLVFRNSADAVLRACLQVVTPGERWVDVGCGSGHLASTMSAHGLQLVALDNDAEMLRYTLARFPGAGVVAAEASMLPLSDRSVDGVVAASVMGCLDDPSSFIRDAVRILRHGGRAIVTFTNRSSLLYGIERRLRGRRSRPPTYASVRLFSRSEAVELLERAGLRVESVRAFNCFVGTGRVTLPPRPLMRPLESLVNLRARTAERLARNILVVAMK